jgi:cytochrome c556
MPKKNPLLAALVLTLTIGAAAVAQDNAGVVVDPAIETMTNEQLVDARQSAMKQNGMTLRGAAGLSGDQAVAAATTLLQNFTNLPDLFKEGSITDKSKALPVIWEKWDDFKGRLDTDAQHALEALNAAKAGDAAAYGAALGAIGQSCGACHQLYRG